MKTISGILLISIMLSACAPVILLISGKPHKKVKFVNSSGSPIQGVSTGIGDPMMPAIMNRSDKNGYLILTKGWPYPPSDLITLKSIGYQNYSMTYDRFPKIIELEHK